MNFVGSDKKWNKQKNKVTIQRV